jgi:glycerophosphoryl diester phosphodiesterase
MKKITTILLFACVVGQAYAWKPLFAGHRGSLRGVENTTEAFKNGVNFYGYTGLEIDVKTTKDGQYVCWHDDDLSRVGHEVSIPYSNFADIKDLVLTQKRDGVTYTATICTVDSFLQFCEDNNVFPIIELKWAVGINNNDMSRFSGLYKLIEKHGLVEEARILTSMQKSLEYVRTNYPKLQCQFLCYSLSESNLEWCIKWQINPSIQTGGFDILDVKRCQKAGLNVGTWTVNSQDNYLKHGNMGAYMMTCDYLRAKEMPELETINWDSIILPEDTTTAIRVESISLSTDYIEMVKGDTAYVDVTILPDSATNQKITAKVSDSPRTFAITCTDKRVRIIAKSAVKTTLTIYCDGVSASCSIVVTEGNTPVDNVTHISQKPNKQFQNGQLIISTQDKKYSVLGQEL